MESKRAKKWVVFYHLYGTTIVVTWSFSEIKATIWFTFTLLHILSNKLYYGCYISWDENPLNRKIFFYLHLFIFHLFMNLLVLCCVDRPLIIDFSEILVREGKDCITYLLYIPVNSLEHKCKFWASDEISEQTWNKL